MSSMSTVGTGASLKPMAVIEARRFARHPLFLLGTAATFVVTLLLVLNDQDRVPGDLLSWPVVPAFFTGLTSLIVAARLTRSTESSDEAIASTPGTEARRTLAVAIACSVPFVVGVVWLAMLIVLVGIWEPAPQEWWFPNMSDLQVWSALIALGPVACLGGGLLGVLVGRWLRFPGAPAVVVLLVVVATMLGSAPVETGHPELRLWTPWTMFHSGTGDDGTASLYAGSAFFYLCYTLCLCAMAVIGAVWHDRAARSGRLVAAFVAAVVIGLGSLGLAMTTGVDRNVQSDPIPHKISD